MMSKEILLIEDDETVSFSLEILLKESGYLIDTAKDGMLGYELARKNQYPVILCDIDLPGMDGKQILEKLKGEGTESQLILFTGFGNINDAVECIKNGACDYFLKPVDDDKLLISIRRAFDRALLMDENRGLKKQLNAVNQCQVVYRSKIMEHILKQARLAADTDATVLITGKSGTGKTMLAKYIHLNSRRSSGQFIEVSCGALSENLLESELFGHKKGAFTGAHADKQGKFEASMGGTIFLDDINSSSLGFQTKLLRVIEEKVFERVGDNQTIAADVRIIAATNVDLMELSGQGNFREDLFHRLNVVGFEMPSLRNRAEDIPALIHEFVRKFSLRHQKNISGVEDNALEILLNYSWPGNIRELENVIERAVIFAQGGELKVSDIPGSLKRNRIEEMPAVHCAEPNLTKALNEFERSHIAKVLQMAQGSRSRAAELLDVSRATLFNKIRKHGIG